jgi:hypothetical protein
MKREFIILFLLFSALGCMDNCSRREASFLPKVNIGKKANELYIKINTLIDIIKVNCPIIYKQKISEGSSEYISLKIAQAINKDDSFFIETINVFHTALFLGKLEKGLFINKITEQPVEVENLTWEDFGEDKNKLAKVLLILVGEKK